MKQYTSGSQDTPAQPLKVTPETKNIQSLEVKVATLETVIHNQSEELLRLRREISRLKADIEQITSVLRRG